MTATTQRSATRRDDLGAPRPPAPGPRPDVEPEPASTFERVLVATFVAVPFLALVAAVPVAWGWGLGWHDVVIAIAFYLVSGLGISIGLHRYFTHGSFKAVRGFKIALAIAGSLAIEGPVITWVADHRRHHKFSDKEGDPHSPWRFGNDWKALTKGLAFAHFGWLLVRGQGQVKERLLAGDPVLRRVLAQPAPCRSDLRQARRAQGPDRHRGARHLAGREARLGIRRPLARCAAAVRQADRQRPQARLDDHRPGGRRDRLDWLSYRLVAMME